MNGGVVVAIWYCNHVWWHTDFSLSFTVYSLILSIGNALCRRERERGKNTTLPLQIGSNLNNNLSWMEYLYRCIYIYLNTFVFLFEFGFYDGSDVVAESDTAPNQIKWNETRTGTVWHILLALVTWLAVWFIWLPCMPTAKETENANHFHQTSCHWRRFSVLFRVHTLTLALTRFHSLPYSMHYTAYRL